MDDSKKQAKVEKSANLGIQANSVHADVLAVGEGARASKQIGRPEHHTQEPVVGSSKGGAAAPSGGVSPSQECDFDLFVSYSSEDRETLVEPLVEALRRRGFTVWLDIGQICLGDEVVASIDQGLKRSRFGLVILSPSSIERFWTRIEWGSLLAQEDATGLKRILPILHGLDSATVTNFSPTLGARVSASSAIGIERLVLVIADALTHSG